MRCVFLDFDGPLMSYRTAYCRISSYPKDHIFESREEGKWGMVDPITCQFLHNICKLYNIQIVVSSSWRANPVCCHEKLKECNLLQFLHEDWKTIQSGDKRGAQIQEWLDRHPDVKSYRIIDDDIGHLPKQEPYFIQCCGQNGLEAREMKKLLEWAQE